MHVQTRRTTLPILLLMGVVLLLLIAAPAASAKAKIVSYDRLTAAGDCLRPFTLLGYLDGDQMNLCEVAPDAVVYRVANPVKRTFRNVGTTYPRSRLVGRYVELWDIDGDAVATASWRCRAC